MILHQENLDYNKYCRYAFGTYVQAHDQPLHSNTNATRSLDCLYLWSLGTHQDGHECWYIATNAIVTRKCGTPIPITPGVIRKVHSIVKSNGTPPGLIITDRNNKILFDSTWIAGLDNDHETFEDDDYDDKTNNNETVDTKNETEDNECSL